MPEGGMGSLDRLHPADGSDSMLGGAKHAKHAKHKKLLKSAEQLKKLLHSITKKIGGATDAEAKEAEMLADAAIEHAKNMRNTVPEEELSNNINVPQINNTNLAQTNGGKKKSKPKPKAKKPKAKKMGGKEILGAGLDAITGGY
jgi:hypothetical protein